MFLSYKQIVIQVIFTYNTKFYEFRDKLGAELDSEMNPTLVLAKLSSAKYRAPALVKYKMD